MVRKRPVIAFALSAIALVCLVRLCSGFVAETESPVRTCLLTLGVVLCGVLAIMFINFLMFAPLLVAIGKLVGKNVKPEDAVCGVCGKSAELASIAPVGSEVATMRYRRQKQVLVGIGMILPAVGLYWLFVLISDIAGVLTHYQGERIGAAVIYNLGYFVFAFTTSCLPVVPLFWIGSADGDELVPHCLSVLMVSILALLCSWWITIGLIESESSYLHAAHWDAGWFLILPACLLCSLAWTLLRRSPRRKRPPCAAGIILRLHYAACALFAITSYLAFRWALPAK